MRGRHAPPLSLAYDYVGLLMFPAICDTGLPDLIGAAGYPSTRALSAWRSVGTLLLAKCARKLPHVPRRPLSGDQGLTFTLGRLRGRR